MYFPPSVSKLNSDIQDSSSRNNKNIRYNPSNTGYTSLREFIINEIFIKSDVSYCVFNATEFDDLPLKNWDFYIEYHCNSGSIYVTAYRFLSNNDIFVRGLDYGLNWIDDWNQISFTTS